MKLCDYGCGKEARHQFKNGKYCCSENIRLCPLEPILCCYCDKKIRKSGIKNHENRCYLNPKNKKLCPICNKPIKNYKGNTTCSYACANIVFRTMENHPNWKGGENGIEYRVICFQHHEKKCIICPENLIVSVHHYDGNKKNNKPENLMPLCPTHHKYWHSKHRYIIRERVEDYRNTFIRNFNMEVVV